MNGFKKFLVVAVLAVTAVGGLAVADSPVLGTQRAEAGPTAGKKLYYAKVYYKGKAGYLGGYKTKADATRYANLWVKGVGKGASFRGEVYMW